MSDRVRIRVTMNGKTPEYELMVDQLKVADLSWIEVLELSMQADSSLRWVLEGLPPELRAKATRS